MAERNGKEKAPRKSTGTATEKKDDNVQQAKAKARSKTELSRQAIEKADDDLQITMQFIPFKLEAPQANRVFLAGCFNGWDPLATPLKRNKDGVWECSISIPKGEHQYRFVVDGEWLDDPLNSERCQNGLGSENCMLLV